jgi:hypothetical protein
VNRPQRFVLIVYCAFIAYCSVWIPWRINYPEGAHERVGYGWVWAGPHRSPPVVYKPPIETPDGLKILTEEDTQSSWRDLNAEPDLLLIVLRLVAVTAILATVFLLVGTWRPQSRRL